MLLRCLTRIANARSCRVLYLPCCMAGWQWLSMCTRVCLHCFQIFPQIVRRSDDSFFHWQRFALCVNESTDAAIAKAKCPFGSLVAVELHSSSSCALMVKRSRSLTKELTWINRCSSSLIATLLRASMASLLPEAPGCSKMVVITSSVGLSFLSVPVSCVLVSCEEYATWIP